MAVLETDDSKSILRKLVEDRMKDAIRKAEELARSGVPAKEALDESGINEVVRNFKAELARQQDETGRRLRNGLSAVVVLLAVLLPGCVTGPGEAGDRLIDLRTLEVQKLRILAEEASSDAARAKLATVDALFQSAYKSGTDAAGRINAELALRLILSRDVKRTEIEAERAQRVRQSSELHANVEKAMGALVDEWRRQGRVRKATFDEFVQITQAGIGLYAEHKKREAEREAREKAEREAATEE